MLDLIHDLSERAQANLHQWQRFAQPPTVRFESDVTHCPVCQRPTNVYKTTQPRRVVTWAHGEFRAIEQVCYCRHHGRSRPRSSDAAGSHSHLRGNAEPMATYRSEALSRIVGRKRTYGFDLIFQVGWRYFVECRNVQEIAAELAARARPVSVSSRSLHRLLDEFVWLVAAVHCTSTDRLGQLFQDNGGYVLCVDGTCEEGSPVHLLCQDAITGIVLAAFTMGSENETEAKPCLTRVQEWFPDPVSTMGDLGRALRAARRAIWPHTPHHVCHYHFVQDVGKDVLKPYHDELDRLFRKSNLTRALTELRRYLGKRIRAQVDVAPLHLNDLLAPIACGDDKTTAHVAGALVQNALRHEGHAGRCPGMEQLDREEISLVISWIQAYASDGRGQGFPFDLPKLAYYGRCVQVHERLAAWLEQSHPRSRQHKHLEKLQGLLSAVVESSDFQTTVAKLERVQQDFARLREVLRVRPVEGPGGIAHEHAFATLAQAQACEQQVDQFRRELRLRLLPDSGAMDLERRCAQTIVDHLDDYWAELFGHALVMNDGGVFLIDRTNNAQEQQHRFAKRCRRRVHGRRSVKHDLERWPAERALVYNLTNAVYVATVYGDLAAAPERFAEAFEHLDATRSAAQHQEATVRLNRRHRKGVALLDYISAARKALINA